MLKSKKAKGEMNTLGPKGDTKVEWDSENEDEVEVAMKQFNDAMKKDFTAYRVKKDGSKARKITKFDPDAERIILVPVVAGG